MVADNPKQINTLDVTKGNDWRTKKPWKNLWGCIEGIEQNCKILYRMKMMDSYQQIRNLHRTRLPERIVYLREEQW